jgi:hypothetical protein
MTPSEISCGLRRRAPTCSVLGERRPMPSVVVVWGREGLDDMSVPCSVFVVCSAQSLFACDPVRRGGG